ncbi:MAG: lamin tail domain-containing protein [Flavobacteriales bacterium]|nr:lamin tail domain-containing protein [Flavobacteriales bacterium]
MIRATFRALSGSFAALATLVASAQFTDDFDDNDYTNGPVWNGDAALFVCVGGQLRSNSPGAANYHLSTPSTQAAGAQWEFFINLKFATSGANYADVYLMSSAADLASGVDGYYVRIGGTQDRVELFRSDAGAGTALIASADGIVNSSSDNPFRIRVKRDAGDLWTLETDDGATGTYALAGSATDATHGSCTHFGIRIEQSTAASPVNNHFFDDIGVGPIPVDVTPPAVVSVTATSATNVDVVFSEPLNGAALGSFDILPFIGVSAAVLDGLDPALVHITPGIALTSGSTYTLVASGAEDLAGNAAASSNTDFSWFVPDEALPGEVVINEILADPTPVLGLPEAEYVEVLNTSSTKTFDLGGWTFSDGGTPAALPSVLLPPGTFAILTDDANAALFAGFGTVVSIGSFPALNNDGDPLALRDDNGQLIDTVTYALAWYNDAVKDDGGWSLERRDPTTPCSSAANWTASTDPQGGTPGAQNSVFAIVPDTQAPALVAAQVLTPDQLRLLFNEPMDLASLAAGTYTLDPPVAVNTVVVENPLAVRLDLAAALVVGQLYTVTAADVQDCPGNAIGTANTAQLALPEAPTAGDVGDQRAAVRPTHRRQRLRGAVQPQQQDAEPGRPGAGQRDRRPDREPPAGEHAAGAAAARAVRGAHRGPSLPGEYLSADRGGARPADRPAELQQRRGRGGAAGRRGRYAGALRLRRRPALRAAEQHRGREPGARGPGAAGGGPHQLAQRRRARGLGHAGLPEQPVQRGPAAHGRAHHRAGHLQSGQRWVPGPADGELPLRAARLHRHPHGVRPGRPPRARAAQQRAAGRGGRGELGRHPRRRQQGPHRPLRAGAGGLRPAGRGGAHPPHGDAGAPVELRGLGGVGRGLRRLLQLLQPLHDAVEVAEVDVALAVLGGLPRR